MRKSLYIHVFVLCGFIALFILGIIYAPALNASSIESFLVDSSTRWDKYGSAGLTHMGNTSTTYAFALQGDRTVYSNYVTSGIALWGNNISCYEVTSSPMGTIMVDNGSSPYDAETQPYYDTQTRHVTNWTITIFSQNFDSGSDSGKARTIAHEIGHVFGLGHVYYSSQIMYGSYSESKNVTSYDLAGMDVMTHEHMHNGAYSTTLEQHSSYMHKARCTTCLAYHLAPCAYTDYHSGMRHYLVVDCPCGNQHTESWSCTGNPCVLPFQILPIHETE